MREREPVAKTEREREEEEYLSGHEFLFLWRKRKPPEEWMEDFLKDSTCYFYVKQAAKVTIGVAVGRNKATCSSEREFKVMFSRMESQSVPSSGSRSHGLRILAPSLPLSGVSPSLSLSGVSPLFPRKMSESVSDRRKPSPSLHV